MACTNQQDVKKIYTEYFEIIDMFFGSIKHHLKKGKESHIDLGRYIANYPLISDLVLDSIEDLFDEIEQFWAKNAKSLIEYVSKRDSLKCVYSGELSPMILEDFIKKSCLYVDSVIIADPIYNITLFQKQFITDNKYYLDKIIRHVFNIWKLKDLILTDLNENILFLLPINIQLVNDKNQQGLFDKAENGVTNYINEITNQNFINSEEALDFLKEATTREDLLTKLKTTSILPRSLQNPDSLNKFLEDFCKTGGQTKLGVLSIGEGLGFYIRSQFIRVQEHKFFCNRLKAEPIYDYELPWHFFNYDIGCGGMDEAIINSLQKDKFEWISNVPIEALKVLRSENDLEYMRELLRKSITDLKAKNDEELLKTSEQIEKNFQEAFKRQRLEMKSLEKKISKIIFLDAPFTLGSALLGSIPRIGALVSFGTLAKDLRDLHTEHKETKKTLSEKQGSIINLLIKSNETK